MNVGLELAEQFKAAVEKIRHEKLVSEIQEAMLDGAELGAKWQRDQLRTDEAVERVANCLHHLDHGDTLDHHDAVCERDRGGCDRRELYTEDARAALTALLGEDR